MGLYLRALLDDACSKSELKYVHGPENIINYLVIEAGKLPASTEWWLAPQLPLALIQERMGEEGGIIELRYEMIWPFKEWILSVTHPENPEWFIEGKELLIAVLLEGIYYNDTKYNAYKDLGEPLKFTNELLLLQWM